MRENQRLGLAAASRAIWTALETGEAEESDKPRK